MKLCVCARTHHVWFSSVAQSCPTLCNPMNRSMPGLPVHHQLPESTQIYVHWFSDAIQCHIQSWPTLCNQYTFFVNYWLYISSSISLNTKLLVTTCILNNAQRIPLGITSASSRGPSSFYAFCLVGNLNFPTLVSEIRSPVCDLIQLTIFLAFFCPSLLRDVMKYSGTQV